MSEDTTGPVIGDGVVTIPVEIEREEEMALPEFVSAVAAHTMEQSAVRYNDGSASTAVTEKQEFVKDLKLVNVAGMQQLEQDGLSNLLMQLKAGGNFPPNTNVQP